MSKEWKHISESDSVWKRLFEQRWGSHLQSEMDDLIPTLSIDNSQNDFGITHNEDLLSSKPKDMGFKQFYKHVLVSRWNGRI